MKTKQKYTVMVNHDAYVKGVFDTVADVIEEFSIDVFPRSGSMLMD